MSTNRPTDGASVVEAELIRSRINTFWGYGNLSGDIWLVGMEEGFNDTKEVLIERLAETAGRPILDIYEDLRSDPVHASWFKEGAPTQSTYRKFIYLLLYLRSGKEPTLEEIREYQIHNFGRKSSDHAILELMPLPCKSLNKSDWIYGSFGVDGLSSRKEYLAEYMPERVEKLRSLIHVHKPKVVIFFSLQYLQDWQSVVVVPLDELISNKLFIAKDDNTIYAVVPHPTARGLSNADWRNIAERTMPLPPLAP